MSHGATINITDDASPVLAAIQNESQAGGIAKAMGESVRILTIEHLRALNARSPRTNFYSKAAKSTTTETSPTEVKVGVTAIGIRQRYFGGYIRPKNKQWIAIPAQQQAIAQRPEEFTNLSFVLFRPDLAGLVRKTGAKGREGIGTKKQAGEVFWWLKKEVYQQPDDTVLPPNTLVVQTALDAATARFFRLRRRNGQIPNP